MTEKEATKAWIVTVHQGETTLLEIIKAKAIPEALAEKGAAEIAVAMTATVIGTEIIVAAVTGVTRERATIRNLAVAWVCLG